MLSIVLVASIILTYIIYLSDYYHGICLGGLFWQLILSCLIWYIIVSTTIVYVWLVYAGKSYCPVLYDIL
jgi:hypothetical protein